MVLSALIIRLPYYLMWLIGRKKSAAVMFYCADYLDYIVFRSVHRYLPFVKIVAKNNFVAKELRKHGVKCSVYPAFPKAVIMARHAHHKFPIKNIIKIGMRHGAFHFKSMIDAKKYNLFDLFLFTSQTELDRAHSMGIVSGKVGGFPKIDSLFDSSINDEELQKLRYRLKINRSKKTLLFSCTWDKSGMSAVHLWYDKLHQLEKKYNILVTVHPWTSKKYFQKLRQNPSIIFLDDMDLNAYYLLTDILISDTSSIIAEFCALNKPVITFNVTGAKRLNSDILNILNSISYRVNDFKELPQKIEYILENDDPQKNQREQYKSIFFDNLDGNAGKRSAGIIKKLLANKLSGFEG